VTINRILSICNGIQLKPRKPVKRTYDSPRRRAQAAETRAAIVRAARDLFVERGYGQTTLADVAARAGVSVETIHKSVGTKAVLLHRAWDVTVGGDDQDVVFHERPEVLAIRAEPDLARRFMLHAQFSTRTAQRIAPFQLMVQAAAGADPAAAAMLEEMGRQRLAGMGVMAAEAAATGQLAVSEDECRDVVWSMTDGTLWHRLVNERGWSNERFAEWLGSVWVERLVAAPPPPPRARRERS
jgi:AcrR family transcriptional regulator